jgi:hypothetical protein
MLPTERIDCPYCGEAIEVVIDASVEHQQYIEDCWVCCRPINFEVAVGSDGAVLVRSWAENEA